MSDPATRMARWLFICCALINVGFSLVGWSHNLREVHEFRQVQTALSARYLQREGWTLAAPLPLFGPPWSAPMEFPLYHVVTAKLSAWSHVPLEQTGRFVSLAFFYLSLPAIFLAARVLGLAASWRWLLLSLIVLTPVYFYYSRAFMIESTALCFSAWFVYLCVRARSAMSLGGWLSAVAVGTLAALAKITTFLVFLPPVILILGHAAWVRRRDRSMRQLALLVGSAMLLALAVGLSWVHFGDIIKRSNPLSAFLASDQLRTWNYGTLALRTEGRFWVAFARHTSSAILSFIGLGSLVLSVVFASRVGRFRIASLIGCYAVGPLVLGNLYFLHDYYFYANGVFLLAALVVGWDELQRRFRMPTVVYAGLIVLTLGAQAQIYLRTYYGVQSRPDLEPPEIAQVIAATTEPNDILLVFGFAWNPGLAYFSDRRAIMVTESNAADPRSLEQVLSRLRDDKIGALVVAGDLRQDRTYLGELCRRLHLRPDPVLHNNEALIFFSEQQIENIASRLVSVRLSSFTFDLPPDTEIQGVKVRTYLPRSFPDRSSVQMFNPAPTRIVCPFGVSSATVEAKPVFNAHAPTVVALPLSATNTELYLEFGILPGAYREEKKTDGVEFVVEMVQPGKANDRLLTRYLDPAGREQDRSPQRITLKLPPHEGGEILFRTLPGPANSIAFDWAYWRNVSLQ